MATPALYNTLTPETRAWLEQQAMRHASCKEIADGLSERLGRTVSISTAHIAAKTARANASITQSAPYITATLDAVMKDSHLSQLVFQLGLVHLMRERIHMEINQHLRQDELSGGSNEP